MNLSPGLWIYELIWWILGPLISLLARFKPSLRPQVKTRQWPAELLKKWQAQRFQHAGSVIFFCSSAGEYEQAKPLAARLAAQGKFVVFVMGSASGLRFAKSQNESLPYLLAPWDRPSRWRKLFAALQPDFFIIVRYELWPGFLKVARRFGPIYLVDAVQSPRLKKQPLARLLWQWLLKSIDHVFVVGPSDYAFFVNELKQPAEKLSQMGDTKYDRVLERRLEPAREAKRREIQEQLKFFLAAARVLIMGSAWPRDLETLLAVYEQVKTAAPSLKLIVAPHDVSLQMGHNMEAYLQKYGLKVCRSSRQGLQAAKAGDDVLLVDELGILPELYASAHVAWVGGAMHHRVHNVLEPACRGIYICFGPSYQTSQEAVWLVEQGLAQVVQNGFDFLKWFRQLTWVQQPPHQALWQAVQQEQGASERILKELADLSRLKST